MLTTSKKAKALLIALLNLNLLFVAACIWPKLATPELFGQMVTAIMALCGLFIGGTATIEGIAAFKGTTTQPA
jgi:hypothetical protein